MAARAQTGDLQTSLSAAGEGTAGGMKISYSIGEMVLVDTKSASNLIVTQGMLQPDEGTAESQDYSGFQQGELQAFPNPTPDVLSINVALLQKGNISLSLYNAAGKRMLTETFNYTGFITKKYSLAKFATAAYVLQVIFTEPGGATKKGTYTIVKTN